MQNSFSFDTEGMRVGDRGSCMFKGLFFSALALLLLASSCDSSDDKMRKEMSKIASQPES